MKLEVGKKYKTKAGLKAFVFSMKGREQEAIGYIELPNNEGHIPAEWFSDGSYYVDKRESANDIVAEWTDTPSSGEGWRLLDIDEDLEVDDEWFSKALNHWVKTGNLLNGVTKQSEGLFYRRRIAPQYVPYTWEDREELRGRWYRKKGDGVESMIHRLKKQGDQFFINSLSSSFFFESCEWLDGTPCGKKVK